MVNTSVNDAQKWTLFVNRLIAKTFTGEVSWEDYSRQTSRERATGPIYVAEVAPNKFVATYRYSYDYYTDIDEFIQRQDVAIELVTDQGMRLWTLPEVSPRFDLIDVIEYEAAGAEETWNALCNEDAP